jgi:hypothetical protein
MATKEDNASIDVSKPKLENFRGNDRDTWDLKTWCLQVSRLDTVQKQGNESTAIIVMEALREQAPSWALLLQDEKPASAASWKLLQPLLLERFDKVVNETQKFKLIAALQQRQNKSSKDFLDRCKTAWYGLLRKLRTKYTEQIKKDAHDDTRNECIKCMFIWACKTTSGWRSISLPATQTPWRQRSRPRSTTNRHSILEGKFREGLTAMAKWQHFRSREMKMLLRKHLHPTDRLQECTR